MTQFRQNIHGKTKEKLTNMLIPLCGPDLDWPIEMRLTAFSVGSTHKLQWKKEKQFLNCQRYVWIIKEKLLQLQTLFASKTAYKPNFS